jgi:hypothetical protein
MNGAPENIGDPDQPGLVTASDPADPGNAATGSTAADRLRARHQRLQQAHHEDIDVPGYDGDLVGRYKIIPPDELRKRARLIAKVPPEQRSEIAAIDQIIAACDSLWSRGDDGQLESLLPDDDTPVRYDQRLAGILGIDSDKPRQIVREVFTVDGDLNLPALEQHANDIGLWIKDVSPEVDAGFAGE